MNSRPETGSGAETPRSAHALLTRPDESVSSIARLLGVVRTRLDKYVVELTTEPARSGAGLIPGVGGTRPGCARVR
ncbi:hypothetical protein NLM24_00610 [Nocardia zapadnayensis]|uniref:hypothetical protein n=1 Tax=Nocardia rhamnosiphila TaxID=426716 RepID=UPI002246C4DF|nr:hypothetical protein [Nocardia zapadnayensis]MCX0269236.1 hypothetical protein [Nocardia zapadnayensis]